LPAPRLTDWLPGPSDTESLPAPVLIQPGSAVVLRTTSFRSLVSTRNRLTPPAGQSTWCALTGVHGNCAARLPTKSVTRTAPPFGASRMEFTVPAGDCTRSAPLSIQTLVGGAAWAVVPKTASCAATRPVTPSPTAAPRR